MREKEGKKNLSYEHKIPIADYSIKFSGWYWGSCIELEKTDCDLHVHVLSMIKLDYTYFIVIVSDLHTVYAILRVSSVVMGSNIIFSTQAMFRRVFVKLQDFPKFNSE